MYNFKLFLKVNNVTGDAEVPLNAANDKAWGSREYLEQVDNNKPLYLPGLVTHHHTVIITGHCS